jgi:hypothetical protein
MDAESYAVLQRTAASEAGLPAGLASRVSGATIGELRRDAQALAIDLGYVQAPEPPRDERGRFQSTGDQALSGQAFNDAVRRWAGRPVADATPPERPTGDLGIGKGAGATPMAPAAPDMNTVIRNAVAASRGVVSAEQLAVDGSF